VAKAGLFPKGTGDLMHHEQKIISCSKVFILSMGQGNKTIYKSSLFKYTLRMSWVEKQKKVNIYTKTMINVRWTP